MLKLLSVFSALGPVYGVYDLAVIIGDDNGADGDQRIRMSFRGDDDESLPGFAAYAICECSESGGLPQGSNGASGYASCRSVDATGTNKKRDPTGTGGMESSYNGTTGILTIKNRGGYGNSESQELVLDGPGTLYTVHLDIEPRDDYLKIMDKENREVLLTGNYSACLRHSTGLEGEYMDKNLSPENQYNSPDFHTTEETQNEENDLCHNILTGKTLMPAPVEVDASPQNPVTLHWSSDADDLNGAIDPVAPDGTSATDFYEGFELLFQFNDVYTADITLNGVDNQFACVGRQSASYVYSGTTWTGTGPLMWVDQHVRSESLADDDFHWPQDIDWLQQCLDAGESNDCVAPKGKPARVYFTDTHTSKLKIDGLIEIDASTEETDARQRGYKITLEKSEPDGRWGYILGQLATAAQFDTTARTRDDLPYAETTVHGPIDTEGHNGATGPYYPTGGSTNTEAPKLMGGGPSGARVFNKHGDVIPGSARGMNPDYMAAERLIDVESWSCMCGDGDAGNPVGNKCATVPQRRCSQTITRTSGESNGAGLQASQGSPPAPIYYLRVRSCRGVQNGEAHNCNMRDSTVIQLIDIAEYEPKVTFFGDLDPKTRVLQGEITVVSPSYSMGIRGYRAYPTANGDDNLALKWSDDTVRDSDDTDDDILTNAELQADALLGSTYTGAVLAGVENPQFMEVLRNHCPPSEDNEDQKYWCSDNDNYQVDTENAEQDNANMCLLAKEPCGNDNPYSPKCMGKTCPFINILPGSQGEFYISRFDSNGNEDNPQTRIGGGDAEGTAPHNFQANTAQRNYSHNEYAQVYLPKAGWLTPIMMDVNVAVTCSPDQADCVGASTNGAGDQLILSRPGSSDTNLVDQTLSQYLDMWSEENVIEWSTDAYDTAQGWTFIYQPDYPEIELALGSPMAQGSSGYRIVPVYHANPTLAPLNTLPAGGNGGSTNAGDGEEGEACDTCTCVGCAVEGGLAADAYVETYDWLVPNVTCTPTTMHCPLPTTWAHINYTTPSLYPEPAEGSCLQQKTGTSSLSGCSEKKNLDTRWYSANSPNTEQPGVSLQNTDEEDNGQKVAADSAETKHSNWAGNCGDATSYFWFEKIACGSTRTFLTDRSLIEDFVQLTPTWEDIQQILDLYYTTKAPLSGTNAGDGFTFITADYHIAPVLPPKVNCTCHAAMDAYASLLSVVSKTPTPGAPITLDPEVLNTGTSKMVATLRMYQDPTYSIPASSVALMPIVVTRFYLEVSTKFTRNRITISDCQASNKEATLNQTAALKPIQNYCHNSTFDTKQERAPNGVTHMDRLSMKKFKFQTDTDVFMQCKIRACAQQPCGFCSGEGDAYRELQDVNLAPIEGEMYSPTIGVRLSPNDHNALTFPDTVPAYQAAPSNQPIVGLGQATQNEAPATTKPIQISSNLVLSSVTASWAIQNREAVTETLRTTMGLTSQEELVITSISKLGRQLADEKIRNLQSGGVKIDFVIGVSDSARAAIAETKVSQLASGSPALAMQFSTALDQSLMRRGQPAARLPTNAMAFSAPVKQENRAYSPQATQVYSNNGAHYNQQMASNTDSTGSDDAKTSEASSDNLILGLVIGAFAMGVMGVMMFLHFSKQKAAQEQQQYYTEEESPDLYASKVAALDQNWQQEGIDQSAW